MAEVMENESVVAVRPSVFISYARADRPLVKPLADALDEAGYAVWWDALIDGGAAFARTIESKLETADVVIVVWSAVSVASDWVRDEAAHGRDHKHLVPVSIDGSEPPLGFRQIHSIDFSRWKGRRSSAEFASLERGIATLGEVVEPLPFAAARPRRDLSRRRMLLGAGSVALVAATAGVIALQPWKGSATFNTVAVLPFANLSGDPAQDYICEGLSEEIRAALVRIARLKVAAPTSSNEFRNNSQDAKTIARKLGVGFLLNGSVRKSGAMLRIAATLTDASTGFASWSQSFDRKLDDIISLQSEIADSVAGALMTRVAPPGQNPGGTHVVAAYDAWLRGRALFHADGGEETDRAALTKFDEAIALDPQFAAAHAARSRSLAAISDQHAPVDQLAALRRAAVDAARRAIELAPDLAAAHAALGYATFAGMLDFKGAALPYERAYALGRGDADIVLLFALFASKTGRREEALRAIAAAKTLDPLNPRVFRAEGSILLAARRFNEVIAPSEQALSMNPKLPSAHANIGMAKMILGQLEDALAEFAEEPSGYWRLAGIAICQHRLGNRPASQAAMTQLIAEFGDGAVYQQAQILAQWGRIGEALDKLERARAVTDSGTTWILNDPMLDPLRGEPRFKNLLSELGLE